jgi:hypothetical protein
MTARDRVRREVSKSAKLSESLIPAKPKSRPQSADFSKTSKVHFLLIYKNVSMTRRLAKRVFSLKKTQLFDDQTLNTFRCLSSRSQQVNQSMSYLMNNFTRSLEQSRVKTLRVRTGSAIHQSADMDDNANLERFFGSGSEIRLPLKNRNFNSQSLNNFDKTKYGALKP